MKSEEGIIASYLHIIILRKSKSASITSASCRLTDAQLISGGRSVILSRSLRAEARNEWGNYLSSQWLAEIQVVVERHLALVVRRETVGVETSTVDNHRSWVASGACLLVEVGLARNMLQLLPSSLLLGFASAVKSSSRQCLFVFWRAPLFRSIYVAVESEELSLQVVMCT